ncbi:MAG: beta-lactamase family protein [Saprospiraceae bacterium]|nr:beta-lactamase family protein [Saprospiraceae bacterium]
MRYSSCLALILLLASLLFLLPTASNAQLTTTQQQEIDALFDDWRENPNQPGLVAGLVKDGEIMYLSGFGSADLSHQKPINPQSTFNISNLSKQFTAFALLFLEEKGQLSLSDDIRKYVPQVPDFGTKITLKHLISQSSGLHEFWVLKELAGWSAQDVFSQDDALELVSRQEELDYLPGTAFSRTTTGMVLLVEVVEKVTGMPFADYMKEHIFEPLGMHNTQFSANSSSMIPNEAIPYQRIEDKMEPHRSNLSVLGVGGLYSSAEDLCKWYLNFHEPKVGSRSLIQKLESPVTLDNGTPYVPGSGKLLYGQLFEHGERGIPKQWLYGFAGGHSMNIFRFHQQGITGFVLGNSGTYHGYYAMMMIFAVIDVDFPEPAQVDFSQIPTQRLSTQELMDFEGYYWNKKGAYARHIFVKDDTLHYGRIGQNRVSKFVPVSPHKFQMLVDSDDYIYLEFDKKAGKNQMAFYPKDGDKAISHQYQPKTYSTPELADFVGTYYAPALDVTYTLSVEGEQLVASNLRKGVIPFIPVKEDLFVSSVWYLNSLQFSRNAKGKVTGFKVVADGLANLKFSKIAEAQKVLQGPEN